jgi:CRISPR-associated endonuclease/helicase Cas3
MKTEELLAKSIENGGLTLYEHTAHVVAAIEYFAAALDFDVKTARNGAILHDLGKAHPHFQNKIKNTGNLKSAWELEEENKYAHRHELSSLGFLPLFPKSEWNELIDLVVAHHKSVENDPRNRGILDLNNNDRNFINFHLKDWEEWAPGALSVAERFGLTTKPIEYSDAKEALSYAVTYCAGKQYGWSPLKGLLRGADHFGSAFTHQTDRILPRTFRRPDLTWFNSDSRKSNLYPLSHTDTSDPRAHTIVVAPTGAGKTDFLMRRCRGRVFYTLPFQASINAMFDRFKHAIPEADIRLLHSTSRLKAGKNHVEETLQPLIGASVKVLTPHQISSVIFGTSGFETTMLDLKGADVILDEIHTYADWAGAMVREIVKALIRLQCRIHVGTATIPSVLYKQLLELLGGSESVYEYKLDNKQLDSFNRHIVFKESDDIERIRQIISEAFVNKERILMVHNTVSRAQESYTRWKNVFPAIPVMLIHSRFRRKDRIRLEETLKQDFDNRSKPEFGPCLVISTQVVEVSLDISFDRMITDCAPLDALIQRFGRVNRARNESTIGKFKPVHVIEPSGVVLPYKMDILRSSFQQLPNGELLEERTIQAKIDAVYPEIEARQIDVHLIFRDGRYAIKELTHRGKSVITEVLEIESATCILESDRELYETGSWETRQALDIPVAFSSIKHKAGKYVQLQVGSWPYVVQQSEDEHTETGLIFHEPSKFL